MKIEIFGSGCQTCEKLHEITKKAVKELELDATIEYVDDIQKIVEMGLMSGPVLAVDGKVMLAGSVPDVARIKDLISNAGKNEPSKCDCANCGKCC